MQPVRSCLPDDAPAAWLGLLLLAVPDCAHAHADEAAHAIVSSQAELSSYTDTDHVSVLSPALGVAARSPTPAWSLGVRYLVDAVSAASVDIVATASRRWSEVRHQVSGHAT